MSYNDQDNKGLPLDNTSNRESAGLLPQIFRTTSNKKFLQSTLDQLTQPGTVKKVNGYIGRQYSKASSGSDIFLESSDFDRQSYQLEPAAVIKDYIGNVKFYKDYVDHINHIKIFGGNVENHQRLNKQEFYAWNPHIDFDKFTNYQNYYWVPYGPKPINVYGKTESIETTMPIFVVDDGDNFAYVFNREVQVRNPEITLYRGQTYFFNIDCKNQPVYIKSERVTGKDSVYNSGVENNGAESGTIKFTVGKNTPDLLYYISSNDENLSGIIKVFDIVENSYIDVEDEIIHKESYKMSNGHYLSNGMKLKFVGKVTPEKYSHDYWYVEGVGSAIKLISERDINVPSTKRSSKFDYDAYDTTAFDMSSSFPNSKDYIVINRSSLDRNSWTRANRWFHQDVIVLSAELNGIEPYLDQSARATRPIIEFESNLKLFNFGHIAKSDVNLIDTVTTDVFSNIEGSLSYYVDGVELSDGMRVIFAADTDSMVSGKVFNVEYITINIPGRQIEFSGTSVSHENNTITFLNPHSIQNGSQIIYINNGYPSITGLTHRQVYYAEVIDNKTIKLYTNSKMTSAVLLQASGTGIHSFELFTGKRRQIRLTKTEDCDAQLNETVLVKEGNSFGGKMMWFNGASWVLGQERLSSNQAPMFDAFDKNGYSFSNNTTYPSSTFGGTTVFSYKLGSGTNDSELGFPLSYRSINNIGDICFNFNLLLDSFQYIESKTLLSKSISTGYLKRIKTLENSEYVNGWDIALVQNTQPVIRIFKESGLVNNFPIDVYDNINSLTDLVVKVYVNGIKIKDSSFTIETKLSGKLIVLDTSISTSDILTIKCYSSHSKNQNGFYDIPISLQNNPLNNDITEFTLGQVADHVTGITENVPGFDGVFPGSSNLRDISNLQQYGTRFVQHSCPLNFSLYHLGSKSANIIEAIEESSDNYGKFKRAFITLIEQSAIHTEPKEHVDYILSEMTKNKQTSSPYYLSDMFAFSGSISNEYTVLDSRTKIYPLTKSFSMSDLSNRSVLIYLNGEQLLFGIDYYFTDDFFTITKDLSENDTIIVYEYDSTDGACCPATPTKLGIYPKYEPKIYIDDTYTVPTKVIQGHDGSITLAYNDYRDDLILELEKRIFNNIKSEYDVSVFDAHDYIPGYDRTSDYTREEVDQILGPYFYRWTNYINNDYTKNYGFDRTNAFTYNYRENYSPKGTDIPAYWRGIYKWMYDTDRPHVCPWEMLGYTIKPVWWNETYGPAPYTSNNLILWDDIRKGIIREPGRPIVVKEKYIRSVLDFGLPVDEYGNLTDPLISGVAQGYVSNSEDLHFQMGDYSPVESAWRKSSYYPYAVIMSAILQHSSDVIGKIFDKSRISKNLCNQYVYSTGKRIRLQDIILPSTLKSSERIQSSGLINFLIDYINSDVQTRLNDYKSDLQLLTNNICSKLGGFSSKEKFRLLMDSKSPKTSSGNFVPEENYEIVLNSSSSIRKLVYSGVSISTTPEGFEIGGFSVDTPYFNIHPFLESDRTIRIGGFSESYTEWKPNTYYVSGKIVNYAGGYYRIQNTHTSNITFEKEYYTVLTQLPVYGGAEVTLRKSWDTRLTTTINYGTVFPSIQSVADFLQGYGAYLQNQGFIFNSYVTNNQTIANWQTAVKEFLFWTTQNWPDNAVISLSPGATELKVKVDYAVINDINDKFYKYQIFNESGKPIDITQLKTNRNKSNFSLSCTNENNGIYCATLYAIQKEHVLILDNKTIFNDILYDLEPGYRQERIRVLGYISRNWDGGFDIPGFIFDQANIQEWQQWTDYKFGDTVKYKEFYYSAKQFVAGSMDFDHDNWVLQADKPVARMLPNWDYKSEQFTDFYDLDTDNFDSEQQKMAQHLIGYQKRQYLDNIIKDDVSQYKFYQGMIIEKGTENSFSKLFDVLSSANKESVTFNEEWAVRRGEYGATTIFDTLELVLDENKLENNPQGIEFVLPWKSSTYDINDVVEYNGIYFRASVAITNPESEFDINNWVEVNDHVHRYVPSSIYIKPSYTINSNKIVLWGDNKKDKFLRTPGYVRYEDVDYSIDKLNDLLNYDIKKFSAITTANAWVDTSSYVFGDNVSYNGKLYTVIYPSIGNLPTNTSYFKLVSPTLTWCAFNDKVYNTNLRTWDVYRFEDHDYSLTWSTLCAVDGTMVFDCGESMQDIIDGDVIGICSTEYNKFVIASDITTTSFNVEDNLFSVSQSLTNVKIYVFRTNRYPDVPPFDGTIGKIWVDNYNNKWAVFTTENSSWALLHKEEPSIDCTKIKKAFLYNKTTSQITKYLDVIDPVYGKISGIADQEIKFKTYHDPAIYTVGTNNVNMSDTSNWTSHHIGQLWWDLTRAKFIVNNDTEIEYRTNTWNQLYHTASIDVYEWVESSYSPTDWDQLADTEQGLAFGISGKTKYGSSVYSVSSRYDNITASYVKTYFFWVKNKNTIPNVSFRKLSATSVAELITSPMYAGYACISLTANNSMLINNIDNYLHDKNTILSMEYWTSDDTSTNYHTEWQLISEHPSTIIPYNIEQKWIDSLVGYDLMNKQLPNYSLPVKLRYGIQNSPRQSMFVNRVEALKQVIERTNSVLKQTLIIDDYDLTPLFDYDTEPSVVSGKWDTEISIDAELQYIGTALLTTAELSATIVDGKIVNVTIIEPGYGYINPPNVEIIDGNNKSGNITVSIDTKGRVISAEINESGEGYTNNTSIIVRPFAVLVKSDSEQNDSWSIRHWKLENNTSINKTWVITSSKSYDVTTYWYYIDWYAVGFNQFTGINSIVDNTSQLYISEHNVGDIVKVKNIGTGGWLLLQKFAETVTTDYTKMYNIIGRQNGSIQFLPSLYEYDTSIFQGTSNNPDPYASYVKLELRKIIEAIKNNILVDELRVEYLKTFFSSVRYVLSEQVYADWVFKSSFIKVTHNVGDLKQKPTYNSDNLESFENYINEIKPYRTKIREYVSVYDGYDNSNSNITDFDLPVFVDADNRYQSIHAYVANDGTVITENNYVEYYPWKSWYDTIGFKIASIEIIDGGSGYTTAPKVRFIGGFGKDASATAFITKGKVNRIVLNNPGTGYLYAPVILLDGGVSSTGTKARASVTIESEAMRTTKISMKFDRISKNYFINDLAKSEEFVGNGNRLQFKLLFAPDLRNNTSSVSVNGVDLLKNEYIFSVKTETTLGYTRYYGIVTLVSAPEIDSIVTVNYMKNIEYLSANDRIKFYYNTSPGQDGKDLSQLMSGIDYGGVIVTGAGFQFSKGWDTIPWDGDVWDGYEPSLDNYSVFVENLTPYVQLPYVPTVGEKINVYINNIRIDEANYDNRFNLSIYNEYDPLVSYSKNDIVKYNNVIYIARYDISPSAFNPLKFEVFTAEHYAYLHPTAVMNTYTFVTAIDWNKNTSYTKGTVVLYNGDYYTVKISHTSTSTFNQEKVISGVIIFIPSGAYDLVADSNDKLTINQYKDNNIIIDGGSAEISTGNSLVIDSINLFKVVSVRYSFDVLVNGLTQNYKIIVLIDGSSIRYTGYGLPGSALPGLSIVLAVTNSDTYIVTYNNTSGYPVTITFSKWEFSIGNAYDSYVDNINDPLFKLSSDTAYLYEQNDSCVIDEFDKNEFYSACYYVQFKSGSLIQLCEVELVHNNDTITVGVVSSYGDSIVDSNKIYGRIVDDSILLLVESNTINVSIVYSRIALSSLALRDIDITDSRRLSINGHFSIEPFSYQSTLNTQVVIDTFDANTFSNCKYQLQLIGSDNTQLIDIDILLPEATGNNAFTPYTVYAGKECGYFTGSVIDNNFKLEFTPAETNVYVIGMKMLSTRPGQISNYEPSLDNNVTILLIKQTSDGSSLEQPYDNINKIALNDYDTQLFGGYFENSTAVGFRPEDLITDGDEFITPTTSYAPEEMLPGYVADTVSIKVFELPKGGSPKVIYNHYKPDGVKTEYSFGQSVPSEKHIMVYNRKIVSGIVKNVARYDYKIDYSKNTITFVDANKIPTVLDSSEGELSVISFGFNSNFLLDTDNVKLSKASDRIVTRAPWLLGKVKATVLVNGERYNYELYRTNESDQNPDAVGIRFAVKLPKDTLIQYMIEFSEVGNINTSTTSVMDIEYIQYTGENDIYTLKNKVITPNTIVTIGDRLLNPGRVFYYTMSNGRNTFTMPAYSAKEYQYEYNDVIVYVDNKKMAFLKDYTFDTGTNSIIIFKYKESSVVTVSLDSLVEYTVGNDGVSLSLVNNIDNPLPVYDIQNPIEMKVISFFDYGSVDIERSVDIIKSESDFLQNPMDLSIFSGKTIGVFVLRNPVLSEDYLWVAKNGNLLTRRTDYYIDEDMIMIKLKDKLVSTDVIQIISFSNNIVRGSLGYMQFKDILNRVHFKRLNKSKATKLAKDLTQDASIIYVDNGLVLDEPNVATNMPGIIEINGERIEYFNKNNNELSILRRGTLGTGVPIIHKMSTNVLNMGFSETIPYTDKNSIDTYVTNRTTSVIPVPYIPKRRGDYEKNIVNFIDAQYGFNLDLTQYTGEYDYHKVISDGTITANGGSTLTVEGDIWIKRNNIWVLLNYDVTDDIEVYIGGVRLKKEWFTKYTDTSYPYSPEGDTSSEPEFRVNGKGYFVKLTKSVPKGIRVTIIRKTGKEWVKSGGNLSTANNPIAKFIRSVDAIWPQYLVDKYQYVVSTDSNFTLESDGTGSDMLELD